MATIASAYPSSLSMSQQAATPIGGFALQNGTPTIISWTTPNDGKAHQVFGFGNIAISSAETGGQISGSFHDPGGNGYGPVLDPGSHGVGTTSLIILSAVVGPNTVVSIAQGTALTVGAAIVYCEIWGS